MSLKIKKKAQNHDLIIGNVYQIDNNFAGDIAEEVGSVALAKKQIVTKYLQYGEYNRVRLLDDNIENLEEFLSLKREFKDVKFTPIHIDENGKENTTKN